MRYVQKKNDIKEELNKLADYLTIDSSGMYLADKKFLVEMPIFLSEKYSISNPYIKAIDDLIFIKKSLSVDEIMTNTNEAVMTSVNQETPFEAIIRVDDYIQVYKSYCLFWMLFVLKIIDALDDKIGVKIRSQAIEYGFNEAMLRDWCRAIEYVLAGNHLSEDCDLECESEEGKRFFLHK